MVHNSSISNSKPRWHFRLIAVFTLTAIAYLAFDQLGGKYVSQVIASQFGDILIEKSRGKITDTSEYIILRIHEVIWLILVAECFFIGGFLVSKPLAHVVNWNWRWLPISILVFAEMNLFLSTAGETGAFWIALFAANDDSKQPGFQIQRLMHRDSAADRKVVILGSSQGGTEIEETLLNRLFGPVVHSANLSYAGAQTFDFLLVQSWYKDDQPDVVICYLSELNFYTAVSGARFLPLLKTTGWKDVSEMKPWLYETGNRVLYGLLGSIIPAFQMRRSLEYALYGTPAVEPTNAMKKVRSIKKSNPNALNKSIQLEKKATKAALNYRITTDTDYHKRALERFIEQSNQRGTHVVLIAGQINPIVSRKLNPEIRRDFISYLNTLGEENQDVTVFMKELPSHPQSDYEDLMHITGEAQLQFTRQLARLLEKQFGWKRTVSKKK